MTDAKALHRDLMKALLSYLPRSVYHDIRRVVTLAWAIVGLCLTRAVRLTAWAEVVEGRAQYAASRVRRFARWLHHTAIDPTKWYPPILTATLRDWTPTTPVCVVLLSDMVDNSTLPFERAAYPLSGGLSTGDAQPDGPEAYARPCQVPLGPAGLPYPALRRL